jgi:hypothetical protein
MKRMIAIAAILGFGLGGVFAALDVYGWPRIAGNELSAPPHPVWTEVVWPFPIDEWGKGKAFRCDASDCGVAVNLYIRAKIGFCNCATGVADDAELERLSDFRLIGEKLAALGAGQAIKVAWMKGRSRAYAIDNSQNSALAVAFNDRCDAIVGTAVVAHPRPVAIEPGLVEFLNGKTVMDWATAALGL